MSLTNYKTTTKYLFNTQLNPNVIRIIQSFLYPSFGDVMKELKNRDDELFINDIFGIDKVNEYRWWDIFHNVKVSKIHPQYGFITVVHREYWIDKTISDMWLWNRRRLRGWKEIKDYDRDGRLDWYCEVNGISKRKGFGRWNKKQKIRALLEL